MGCAHNKNTNGFTLVEIAIVMIIVGLLIGGTFGGMKLIENMQVNKTVQDLKAIESAALTFKDTYGRLPGDLANSAARLPNCTVAPCATGGNGDRRIGGTNVTAVALTDTDERFVFWHHLQAADLLSMGYKNTTNTSFGEGQPESSLQGGFRNFGYFSGNYWAQSMRSHLIMITPRETTVLSGTSADSSINCVQMRSLDAKLDDDRPTTGRLVNGACMTAGGWANPSSDWVITTALAYAVFFPRF